jgi:hypothetical protein
LEKSSRIQSATASADCSACFALGVMHACKKTVKIVFPNMIVDLVDRIGFAHFVGFLEGKIAFFRADERELKEKWNVHPLVLLLCIHINGKETYRTNVSLFKKEAKEVWGTLGLVELKKSKKIIEKADFDNRESLSCGYTLI